MEFCQNSKFLCREEQIFWEESCQNSTFCTETEENILIGILSQFNIFVGRQKQTFKGKFCQNFTLLYGDK